LKLIILPQAQADLDAITEPLLSRIARRIEALTQFPELGSQMSKLFTSYRSTVVDFFRIVYRVRDSETLEVGFIRDCRRRLPKRP